MTKTSKTIVFFGSGPVAAESLKLLSQNFEIEAVVTKPKPAHHRGETPVLEVCEKRGFKVFTPTSKKELSEVFATRPVASEIGIVIDYGIIIAQDVIDYFPMGIINSHFSLLPEWRGADPISFAILSGQPKTGVSLMVIDAGMDTGKLITSRAIAIDAADTTPTLTKKLIHLSNELLSEYLPDYMTGNIKARQQPHPDRATYSRKLLKEDGIIDWNKPAQQIEREIRAYNEWPKSRSVLAGKDVIITSVNIEYKNGSAGTFAIEDKKLIAYCGENALIIERLKPAGKQEMTGEAFIAGYKSLL